MKPSDLLEIVRNAERAVKEEESKERTKNRGIRLFEKYDPSADKTTGYVMVSIGEGTYLVGNPHNKESGAYTVTRESCTCPRAQHHECKHREAVCYWLDNYEFYLADMTNTNRKMVVFGGKKDGD